jgi:site-specific recombinase XerD
MNILDLLPRYAIYLEHERKLAKQTRIAYLSDLRVLARFISDDVTAINVDNLRAYMRDLSEKGAATNTIRRKFRGFATFWQWMRMEGIVEDVPTDRIRLPKRTVP